MRGNMKKVEKWKLFFGAFSIPLLKSSHHKKNKNAKKFYYYELL